MLARKSIAGWADRQRYAVLPLLTEMMSQHFAKQCVMRFLYRRFAEEELAAAAAAQQQHRRSLLQSQAAAVSEARVQAMSHRLADQR